MEIEEETKKTVASVESKKNDSVAKSNEDMFLKMQAQIDELIKLKNAPEKEDTVSVLKALVAEIKQKPDSEKYGGEDTYTRPEDIDPEDVLSKGVTFFSHQVAYCIADDKRNGHNVRTPFGRPINFIYQSTKQVKSGNETKLHNLSTYTSHSKVEIEWIMAHKFFGTIFFSTHSEALSIDAMKASRLARIILTLQRYDVHKIVRMAKGLGIAQSPDINGLRIAIANMQAERELKAEYESNAIKVKEAIIEGDILKDPVT